MPKPADAKGSVPEMKSNKRELLNSLVEEHSQSLYRKAYRYFNDPILAEDLVQETFLAATQAIENFEGRSSYKTWLQGILKHKILDRLRKKTREEVLLKECDSVENHCPDSQLFNDVGHWEIPRGPVAWNQNPESIAEQKDFLGVLDKCLQKFPENSKRLFLLREVEGLTREELCTEFNLTSTNIGVILYRMRMSLQQCLQINWFQGKAGTAK